MALCGVSVVGYSEESVKQTITSLRKYLQECVERGYLPECAYLNDAIEKIRDERKAMHEPDLDEEAREAQRRLDDARAAHDDQEASWQNKLAQIDTEEELALQELELKWEEARATLEDEWNSDKVKSRFNKPSPTLIDLRRTARRLLSVHRFDESLIVAREISALEANEGEEATRRMALAYTVAVDRLDRKFYNDRQTLETTFVTRRSQAERARDATMLPLARKVSKYQAKEELINEKRRRNQSAKSALSSSKRVIPPDVTIASKGAKLRLPDVKTAKRSSLGITRPGSMISARKRQGSRIGKEGDLG
jgi:hypothetical protein